MPSMSRSAIPLQSGGGQGQHLPYPYATAVAGVSVAPHLSGGPNLNPLMSVVGSYAPAIAGAGAVHSLGVDVLQAPAAHTHPARNPNIEADRKSVV